MSYENYRTRVNLHGTSDRERAISNYKEAIANSFTSSPSYQEVYINFSPTKTGVWIVDNSEIKDTQKILSQYDNPIVVGDIVEWDSVKWLIIIKDDMTDVYHKGTIDKCNSTLTLQTGSTETITGYDSLGRPIKSIVPTVTDFPCVVKSRISLNDANQADKAINIPQGNIIISIRYNSTHPIREGTEFNVYGNKWDIVEVDSTKVVNGVGIITFIASKQV